MIVFRLSKENIPLAVEEALALTNAQDFELIDNLLIIDPEFTDFDRLAYTRSVYDLLFIAYKHDLLQKFERFDWQSVFKKDFSLRIFNCDFEEKELAGFIWRGVKKPVVNLKNPKTEIHLFKQKSKFFCCLLKKNIVGSFESRKAHKRPVLHPTTLHPKLARAVVNLTGIQKGENLLDPFCGSGGILLEAGLMGCKTIGFDVNQGYLDKAEINLKHFKIKDFKLEKKDALTIKRKYKYVVADLPYGLNTPTTNLKKLYQDWLFTLEKILKGSAVIIFPHFMPYKKLINKTNLKIEKEFDYFLHKSLSKKIVLLS